MRPPESVRKIRENPKFEQLIKARAGFANVLSVVMMAIYFAFILAVAFAPDLLGTPIGDSVITYGIPVGLLVIFSAFALTGIYVAKANTLFDRLTKQIIEETK
ncbi:MAG: DUF485 domain-containing protein [Alphaproteobacteria bacterium]|jgi:uncharacterized membrane protein (DUF485 family)|nr:DUF485 domain-containing protein [Alphaproteobacteria bacterium]